MSNPKIHEGFLDVFYVFHFNDQKEDIMKSRDYQKNTRKIIKVWDNHNVGDAGKGSKP